MDKIIYFTDSHISSPKKDITEDGRPLYYNRFIKLCNLVADTAVTEKANYIVHGGDLFDSFRIDSYDLDTVVTGIGNIRKILDTNGLKDTLLLFLIGNHEIQDTNGKINPLVALDSLPNCKVVREKHKEDYLCFIPYSQSDLIPRSRSKVLFTHTDFAFLKNSRYHSIHKSNLTNFSKTVINGHVHYPQVYKNVYCPGGSNGIDFRDIFFFDNKDMYELPSIAVFETSKDKGVISYNRILNTHSPLHLKFVNITYDDLVSRLAYLRNTLNFDLIYFNLTSNDSKVLENKHKLIELGLQRLIPIIEQTTVEEFSENVNNKVKSVDEVVYEILNENEIELFEKVVGALDVAV